MKKTETIPVVKLDTKSALKPFIHSKVTNVPRIPKGNMLVLFSGANRKQNCCHIAALFLNALFVVALFYTTKLQFEEMLF